MAGDSDRERLERLRNRIAEAQGGDREAKGSVDEHHSLANFAWRMVTELVAGLLLGFGIGYGLDYLFGTIPILLVIFTLAGLAAGVQTMLRTAREMERRRAAEEKQKAAGTRGTGRGDGQGG